MNFNKTIIVTKPRLSASIASELDRDNKDFMNEIKQLKKNFEALKTPKLYQKLISQYKTHLRGKKINDVNISGINGTSMINFTSGSKLDVKGNLRLLDHNDNSTMDASHKNIIKDESVNFTQLSNYKYNQCDKNNSYQVYTSQNKLNIETINVEIQTDNNIFGEFNTKYKILGEEYLKIRSAYIQTINIIKGLEENLTKIRIENIKLDKALKVAQENLAVKGKNQNNTSSQFALPSEFKSNWDSLTKDQLINVYADFIDNPIIVLNLIQDIILICYDMVKSSIKDTTKNLMKTLSLPDKSESNLMKYILNLYQDHYSYIFQCDDNKFNKIIEKYRNNSQKIFQHQYNSLFQNNKIEEDQDYRLNHMKNNSSNDTICNNANNIITNINSNSSNINESTSNKGSLNNDTLINAEKSNDIIIDKSNENNPILPFKIEKITEYEEYFEQLLESSDFKKFVCNLYSLCLYMQLNEPNLKIPIDNFKNRKYEYRSFKKNEYICIDGFAKEGSPCLVIVPPVMRNNYPYNGIKPSVLVLPDSFAIESIIEIMNKVEKEEEIKRIKKLEKDKEEAEKLEKDCKNEEFDISKNLTCLNFQIPNFSFDLKILDETSLGLLHNISMDGGMATHNNTILTSVGCVGPFKESLQLGQNSPNHTKPLDTVKLDTKVPDEYPSKVALSPNFNSINENIKQDLLQNTETNNNNNISENSKISDDISKNTGYTERTKNAPRRLYPPYFFTEKKVPKKKNDDQLLYTPQALKEPNEYQNDSANDKFNEISHFQTLMENLKKDANKTPTRKVFLEIPNITSKINKCEIPKQTNHSTHSKKSNSAIIASNYKSQSPDDPNYQRIKNRTSANLSRVPESYRFYSNLEPQHNNNLHKPPCQQKIKPSLAERVKALYVSQICPLEDKENFHNYTGRQSHIDGRISQRPSIYNIEADIRSKRNLSSLSPNNQNQSTTALYDINIEAMNNGRKTHNIQEVLLNKIENHPLKNKELKEKLKKSILNTRNNNLLNLNENPDQILANKSTKKNINNVGNDRNKENLQNELKSTIGSLKQSIELLKTAKFIGGHYLKSRRQEYNEKLNNSMAGKIINQSNRLCEISRNDEPQTFFSNINEEMTSTAALQTAQKVNNFVKLMADEKKNKTNEKRLYIDQPKSDNKVENMNKCTKNSCIEEDRITFYRANSQKKVDFEKIKSSARSISSNRFTYILNEENNDNDILSSNSNSLYDDELELDNNQNKSFNKYKNKINKYTNEYKTHQLQNIMMNDINNKSLIYKKEPQGQTQNQYNTNQQYKQQINKKKYDHGKLFDMLKKLERKEQDKEVS